MQEKELIKWAEEKFAYLNSPVYNIFAFNKINNLIELYFPGSWK